jgi:outer membrane protein OmpA-like peptidoglycan-associated protein
MATSIIDTIAQFASPALTSRLSATTGEPASNIDTGLRTAISTIVGGLSARASDPDAVSQIYAMAIDPTNDTSVFDGGEHLMSRVTSSADGTASSNFIQSLLFGNRESSVVDTLATQAGVSGTTAKSLLSIATSLIMAYLGKMIRTENLDATALASRLMAERESVASRLPAGMAKFFPTLGTMGSDRIAAETVNRFASDLRARSAWAWVLPVMLAALGAWALVTWLDHPRERQSALNTREPSAVGTSGFVNRELPGGVSLRFPPNGTEARLLSFIQGSAPITKDTWFEFDRLNFETDSAVLRPDSRDQLTNIAAILKAYPGAHVKIGGYTDNSGNRAANRQLSEARAEAVRDALDRLGVDPSRVQAKGYGDQHPIADNNTAEGRAQNRRVAILVTAK